MSAIELQVEKKDDEKVLELAKEGKVTEEKIEKSLNYDELTEEEKKAVDDFKVLVLMRILEHNQLEKLVTYLQI